MIAQSHIKIARVAMDQVKGRGIYLDKTAFLLGNILPDFSPYHKLISHYPKDSAGYLMKVAEDIILSIDSASIKATSLKLGVISHYLTDYCCYPHFNEQRFTNKGILEHIEYEVVLNREMDSILGRQEMSKERTMGSMENILEFQKETYKNNKIYSDDVSSALCLVINTVENIHKWKSVS